MQEKKYFHDDGGFLFVTHGMQHYEEVFPEDVAEILNNQEKKISDVRAQVEEFRTLTQTVKQVLENQFTSKDDKLMFLKTFPEDLTAFADGLNQILADFKNDGCEPLPFEPGVDGVAENE